MTDAIKKLFDLLIQKEKSGSDYTGKVTSVDGNTARVQFDGSDIVDTPVRMSVGASPGDAVRVRVANGKAWITGNDSAPPNDSAEAMKEIEATNAHINKIETENIVGENGWINLKEAKFDFGGDALSWNGKILKVKGNVNASGGEIAGWKIEPQWLSKTVDSGGTRYQAFFYVPDSPNPNSNAFLGLRTSTDGGTTWSYPFAVQYGGKLVSSNADISGKIEATSGKFGIFTISGNSITTSTSSSSNRVEITTYDADTATPAVLVRNGANNTVWAKLRDSGLTVASGTKASAYGASACIVDGEIGGATLYEGGVSLSNKYAPISNSDPVLKKNIAKSSMNAIALLKRITMHAFDWKRNNKHWDVGFIAPELHEIDPNMADPPTGENGSYWNVNSFYMVGVLTKAVQELTERVEALEKGDR